MADDALFELTPRSGEDADVPKAPARYETVNREQIELHPTDLETLLPPGHAARLVWRFVEGLNLGQFYDAIKAREGTAGRPPIDPKILIALWLYATIDGVGSARELCRLCYSHDAYRWVRGGVSVNPHTLSDFRVDHHAALDDLLTQSITVLVHEGIVTLARVAQDGTRVRASAGVGSFRRAASLSEAQRAARKQVERTQRQSDGPGRSRAAAADARAAADRLARVDAAVRELETVTATKARVRAEGKKASAPRVSTTDPSARVMKMADGGFRPAYNVHFATDMEGHAIVGAAVTNVSDDHDAFVPMVDQITRRTGRAPTAMVVDGGVSSHAAITTLAADGVVVYAPPRKRQGVIDPAVPRPRDSAAVAEWRARMATAEAKAVYRQRGAVAERINADGRVHRTLNQIMVRGVQKVHTWVLWVAVAHNMMRLLEIVPHEMT